MHELRVKCGRKTVRLSQFGGRELSGSSDEGALAEAAAIASSTEDPASGIGAPSPGLRCHGVKYRSARCCDA